MIIRLRWTPREGDHEDQYMLQDVDPIYDREGGRKNNEKDYFPSGNA